MRAWCARLGPGHHLHPYHAPYDRGRPLLHSADRPPKRSTGPTEYTPTFANWRPGIDEAGPGPVLGPWSVLTGARDFKAYGAGKGPTQSA